MKTKNKEICLSRSQLLFAWMAEMGRRGYCEDYIGASTVDFYECVDGLDSSDEFNIEE